MSSLGCWEASEVAQPHNSKKDLAVLCAVIMKQPREFSVPRKGAVETLKSALALMFSLDPVQRMTLERIVASNPWHCSSMHP